MWNKQQIERLVNTRDDDLLLVFPWHTRSELRRIKAVNETNINPKILFIDIETAPIESYTWWIYDQCISINQIKEDWFVLSWSAKWLWEKEIKHARLTWKDALRKNDRLIIKEIWSLIDAADIVVGHNLDRFDIKKINTRFIKHWLPIPSYYQTIDTLKIARKFFGITSNKLDYLCKFLWLKRKISTWWFELWSECLKWNEKALKQMDEYCRNDTVILEELYLKLEKYNITQYGQIKKRYIKNKAIT